MSKIDEIFTQLRSLDRSGLVTYVTAGDPDKESSGVILKALDLSGVDVLEIGIPFSDPLADGPVIQRASERAIAGGTTLASSLELIGQVRPTISAAVIVFTYVNPMLAYGVEKFMRHASKVGVDGLLVLDLPLEESKEFRDSSISAGIDPIFLVSPTTTDERIQQAAELGRGFLYGISRLGVTGERDAISSEAKLLVERVRRFTDLPVALGFGISTPEQVAEVGRFADAAVVGSGLVKKISNVSNGENLAGVVSQYIRWLKGESLIH